MKEDKLLELRAEPDDIKSEHLALLLAKHTGSLDTDGSEIPTCIASMLALV